MINGLNLEALAAYKETVKKNAKNGLYKSSVNATWVKGTLVEVKTNNLMLGDEQISHDYSFTIDEPEQLLGRHSMPTPQDYLLGGLSGYMIVTFVAMYSTKSIDLKSVKLDIKSGLDLQGFLGINENSSVGFEAIEYAFTVKGNGTESQFQEAAEEVMKYSPNYATMANKVKMVAILNILPE
ncbi:OsmC family protein [Crocinitomix catalasitica]|uniref:OsmC family protein n=1 Tax=Crocinitomix catalasitica TaxID=184607 RepID=UPI0005672669|nr:OsmC family protein [Crocinitomix catalasitica]